MPGGQQTVRAWIVYPERKDKAPVVIVIQEIFGLTDWIRAVADQLARDGFIALAPDLLTGKGPNGGNTDAFANRDAVVAAVRGLDPAEVTARLHAVREHGIKLPAANGKSATVGFCWGGAHELRLRHATARARRRGRVLRHVTRSRGRSPRSRHQCSDSTGRTMRV